MMCHICIIHRWGSNSKRRTRFVRRSSFIGTGTYVVNVPEVGFRPLRRKLIHASRGNTISLEAIAIVMSQKKTQK